MYADFESIPEKVDIVETEKTKIEQLHQLLSFFCYLVADSKLPDFILDQILNEPFLYRGKDCTQVFMEHVIYIANLIADLLDINIPMNQLSQTEKDRVRSCERCEFCSSECTFFNTPKLDHNHLNGSFRNILRSKCNLARQEQKFLPVFLHGLSNYDAHYIVTNLGLDEHEIDVIPNSKEK